MATSPHPTAASSDGHPVEGASSRPLGPNNRPALPLVVVLSTGGTIDSVTDPLAGRVPGRTNDALHERLSNVADCEVRIVPVFAQSSFALTTAQLHLLRHTVADQLLDPRVAGVVITHGTDTLEETAFSLHLRHGDARPVVVTGAIRPADDAEPDGPSNVRDAVIVAASASARNRGVLVVFGGLIFSAAGTRKVDTAALAAFDSPDAGRIGSMRCGRASFVHGAPPAAPTPTAMGGRNSAPIRVDIVAMYPGADDVALRAHAAAGARGLVLEAMGSGNAPPGLVTAISDLTRAGLIVVVSSRVHRGPIAPLYGGPGGGRDLVAAGAIPAGWMRPSQARIALSALLSHHDDHSSVRDAFVTLAAKQ